jgi:hypothetical protein
MTSKVDIRYATAMDVAEYYKGPVAHTIKAVVMTVDDEVLAIGGIAYINQMALAFMEMLPGAERYKLSLIKASKRAMKEFFSSVRPLLALCDDRLPTAENYLKRMGFVPLSDDYYIWQGDH